MQFDDFKEELNMRDGYYLSAFIFIDELSHLMDVKVRHDQNISLFHKKGDYIKLIHFWELERITGVKKHATTFYDLDSAIKFINKLLGRYNCTIDDMNEIWGTPQLATSKRYLFNSDISCHSIYHLYSGMMSDSEKFYNDRIMAFSADAGPDAVIEHDASEKYFYSGAIVNNGNIEIRKISSPGRLWSYSKRKFGLQEGSLMALASASTATLLKDYSEVLELYAKDSYKQAQNYVDKITESCKKIIQSNDLTMFTGLDSRFSEEDNLISMVMKVVQRSSERIMDYNIECLRNEFNINTEEFYLSMTGGFALNCPTNTYLMEKYKFKGFITVPCVSDCGLSLGIGLYAFSKGESEKFRFKFENAYYGDSCDDLESVVALSEYTEFIESISEIKGDQFVKDIETYPVVWFNGRAEVGPRALGNRSIISGSRTNEMKDALNKIKQRQWWRPVAPIVLKEYTGVYFDRCEESPYMLQVYKVKEEKLSKLPAISHLDNSARIQTIDKNSQPLLYELIKHYGDHGGEYVVCNTSLNDINEPIINTIQEAFNFALRKNIGVIYANGKRIELKNHSDYKDTKPKMRDLSEFNLFDSISMEEKIKEINNENISKEEYTCYIENRHLFPEFDLTDKKSVRRLRMIYTMIKNDVGEVFDRG